MAHEVTGGFWANSIGAVLLLLGSAFFVGSEYAAVSMRRGRLEGLAKKGSKPAKRLLKIADDLSPYIAGTQIGITMISVAMGSFTEPFVTQLLSGAMQGVDPRISQVFSFIVVLFVLVVAGELVPKYLALQFPERFIMLTYRPLELFVKVFRPVIWFAQKSSHLLLKLFRVDVTAGKDTLAKDELVLLVQATGTEGILEKEHADLVTRALRLDVLDARDIMVHRLDIRWMDSNISNADILSKIGKMGQSRFPVCDGDVDEIIGIAYVVDVIRAISRSDFKLSKIVRPVVAIPENLSMEKIVQTMREHKTQFLVVMDEYGGTSGIITLEDVVEEVFGELEDGPESERPPIDAFPNGRVSARADVRFDELVSKLGLSLDSGDNTDTLATIIMDELERVPRSGDTVDTVLGVMRVENMARRRVTRVGIQLKPELLSNGSED
jgi:CBS domain containing-hemolysin-like protein